MASAPQPYDILVMRLEREAARRPWLYKLRVGLAGTLGYAVVFCAVALPLAALFGVYLLLQSAAAHTAVIGSGPWVFLLVLGIAATVLVGLQTLWLALPEPKGLELQRGEAVPLFQEIDRLRRDLKAPRISHVLLTDEFSAGVLHLPRKTLLGRPKNLLLLGVPLMASLSPDQFRAVLAHEIGHVSRAHGTFAGWIYRANQTWSQLLDALDGATGLLPRLARRFLRWYIPYLQACSFAIRRADELEADRAAVRTVGADPMASALVATALVARRLADRQTNGVDRHTAHRWLNDAVSRRTEPGDTHPSLAARLRAIGREPSVPDAPAVTAFERYLGHRALPLAERSGVLVVQRHNDADNVTTTQLHVRAAGPAPFVIALRQHNQ